MWILTTNRDLAGPVGDLTSNVMWILTTNRDLAGPVGDLTRTGDQPSGKVVLVIRYRTRQGDNQHGIRTTREDVCALKLVKLESTHVVSCCSDSVLVVSLTCPAPDHQHHFPTWLVTCSSQVSYWSS